MRYADSVGLDRIVAKMDALGAASASFKPAALLTSMASKGARFTQA